MSIEMSQSEFETMMLSHMGIVNIIRPGIEQDQACAFANVSWTPDELRAVLGAESHTFEGKFDNYTVWTLAGYTVMHKARKGFVTLYCPDGTQSDVAVSVFTEFRTLIVGTADRIEQRRILRNRMGL